MLSRKHVIAKHDKDDPGLALFDQFINAGTCKSILSTFHQLCDILGLKTADHRQFYPRLKGRISSWKAQSIWTKLDKRATHKEYRRGEACKNTRVFVIGSGPCGLRVAIEAAFLGAKVVVVEKRDQFSRNNVLHLWPYVITDLRNLAAKKFFGKFCAGAIDHISIRQLQCILLKVALLVGVEIHTNTSFEGLIEPTSPDELTCTKERVGWKAKILPENSPVSEFEFDVLIGADGKRNTLTGFRRKEFRGKLAIAITANFINHNTQAEASVEEISGVAFIFNQKFFLDLREQTAIDLENIVYYKDDTHYFVMTAKKNSLLEKGVLLNDYNNTIQLLSKGNVNQEALLSYAREAADFSTEYQMPHMEYAINHYGQSDVAMFDFTSMFAAHNASRMIERNEHKLLIGLVGDSLLEPFWPTGTGCARGFLGAMDAAWMIRGFASGKMTPLEVIAERESVFLLLSQTTPENIHKNFHEYTIDPNTRYPNLNSKFIKPEQVRHLCDSGDGSITDQVVELPAKRARNEDYIDSYTLLRWCQNLLNTGKYFSIHVTDFTTSWKSGLALCALVHIFKPDLIDFNSLSAANVAENNQLVFDVALRELGVQPVMSGEDMANCDIPDKLTMVSYLSQLYDVLKKEPPPISEVPKIIPLDEAPKPAKPAFKKTSLLNRLSNRFSKAKKRKDKEDIPDYSTPSFGSKRHREEKENDISLTGYNKLPMDELKNKLTLGNKLDEAIKRPNNTDLQSNVNVRQMGELLVSKFRGNDLETPDSTKRMPASEFCVFCKKRVYLMERMSAEGLFFHRGCLKCSYCAVTLRLGNYSFENSPSGEPLFYCFRHFGMMMTRTQRKRNLEHGYEKQVGTAQSVDDEGPPSKMSLPDRGDTSTPKKIPTPLQLPDEPFTKALRTPERVEFENSLEGEEETEEEQTEHNLRASQSCDQLIEDDEEESDSDDEFTNMELAHILSQWSSDEELEDEVMEDEKTETRKLLATWQKRHSHENLLNMEDEEELWSDEEDAEEGSDYESDEEEDEGSLTETESRNGDLAKESEDSDSNANSKVIIGSVSPAKTPTSPAAVKAARENFFSSVPEVVRLDPFSMFGMGKRTEANGNKEEVTQGDDKNNDDVEMEAEEQATPKSVRRKKRHKEYEELQEEEESDSLSEEMTNRVMGRTEEEEGDLEEEDVFDKLAVSKAMEQLLQDLDKHSGDEKAGDSELEEGKFDDVHGYEHVGMSGDMDNGEVVETEEVVLRVKSQKKNNNDDDEGSDTERAVLNSVMEMSDTEPMPLGTGEDTLKALMDSLEAMNNQDEMLEKGENSSDNLHQNIDDRFVTTRGRRKKKRSRARKSINSESSMTMSTPSGSSQSSFGSLSAEGYDEDNMNNEDDDEKPDEDLLRDYQLTLSQALGEDEPEDSERSDNRKADQTLTEAVEIEEDEDSMTSSMNSTMDNSAIDNMELDTSSKSSTEKRDRKKKSKSNIVRKFQSRQKIKGEKSLRTDTGKCLNFSGDVDKLTLDVTEEIFYTPTAEISDLGPPAPSGNGPRMLTDLKTADKKHLVPSPTPSASSPQRQQNKSKITKSSPSNKKTDIPEAHTCSTEKGKTKIAVDRSKLDSDPSSPKLPIEMSYPAEYGRKKIPLDSSLRAEQMAEEVRKSIGDSIEDIPFADDSGGEMSPVEDVFYTPQTSVKPTVHPGKAERVPVSKTGTDIRKRLLPTPRKTDDTPGVLPPDKIKEIHQAEMEKAKEKARERARLKSDEELGLRNMNRYHNAPVKLRGLNVGVISESDTDPGEVSRDSDDTRSPISPLSPGTSESGDATSPTVKKSKNKRKSKSTDSKSSQDEQKSDSSSARKDKEKRKSLLSMLLPSKTPDKGKDNGSVLVNGASKTPKAKMSKTSDKNKKISKSSAKKEKKKRRRTESKENLDTDLSENLRDLKIGTVWYDNLGSDKNERERAFLAARANVAPTAEVEEMYDSDESSWSNMSLRSISRHMSRHQMGDEEMTEKVSRKVQHAARRQQKQREQKRLRMAQEIQRRLEEVDVKQRELEERGIRVEQSIRQTGADPQPESLPSNDLMEEWFNLVHEKNALVRYESELMVHAKELELEDRQGRLEQKLRDRMAVNDQKKTDDDIAEEQKILNELLAVVEERDRLVASLEEERLREQEEDKDLESIMLKKGFMLSPLGHTEKVKMLDLSSESADNSFI